MKANKIYFLLPVVMLLITSCKKDFLDLKPNTYLSGATYFKNEDDVLNAVNAVYPLYRSQLDIYIQMTEMRSDNTCNQYNSSERATNSTHREELDEFRDNSANNYTNYWNIAYGAIYRANSVLQRIGDIDFKESAVKDRATGECYFARAFFYFNLVRFYGDVALITEPVTDVSSSFSIGRSSVEEVYTQILSDVTEAIKLLPATYTTANIGRITKGAALTLLAKIQMTRKDFNAAVSPLRQVVAIGYALQPDYADCFRPANKNNKESILEIQYSSVISGQSNGAVMGWVPFRSEAWLAIFGYPGGLNYSYNLPTKDMIDAYEPGDVRKAISLKEGYTNAGGQFNSIPYINKWVAFVDPVQGRNDCNFPIYRYADVLLMLAEAINEVSGPTGEATGYLNQIRSRGSLAAVNPAGKEDLRLAIEMERRVELAFEGHRWFDLVRTDRAIPVMTAHGIKEKANPSTARGPSEQYLPSAFTIEAYRLIYPIPLSEVNKNPNVLTQNPNY